MKKLAALIVSLCFLAAGGSAYAQSKANSKLLISTSMGNIEIELYPDKAPETVKNFLEYVKAGYYDGLIFHRVIKGFMIQGGGFDGNMKEKPTNAPIKIESDNGLKNEKGSIAMARTNNPNSATSQFFINVADNPFLDYKAPTIAGYGYAVFGKVIKGMDIVDKIAQVETGRKGFFDDVPLKTVTIKSIKEIK